MCIATIVTSNRVVTTICPSQQGLCACACRSLLENRDRLVENVRGGIDSARELLPRGGEATSQQLLKRCFPAQLQHAGGSGERRKSYLLHGQQVSVKDVSTRNICWQGSVALVY